MQLKLDFNNEKYNFMRIKFKQRFRISIKCLNLSYCISIPSPTNKMLHIKTIESTLWLFQVLISAIHRLHVNDTWLRWAAKKMKPRKQLNYSFYCAINDKHTDRYNKLKCCHDFIQYSHLKSLKKVLNFQCYTHFMPSNPFSPGIRLRPQNILFSRWGTKIKKKSQSLAPSDISTRL